MCRGVVVVNYDSKPLNKRVYEVTRKMHATHLLVHFIVLRFPFLLQQDGGGDDGWVEPSSRRRSVSAQTLVSIEPANSAFKIECLNKWVIERTNEPTNKRMSRWRRWQQQQQQGDFLLFLHEISVSWVFRLSKYPINILKRHQNMPWLFLWQTSLSEFSIFAFYLFFNWLDVEVEKNEENKKNERPCLLIERSRNHLRTDGWANPVHNRERASQLEGGIRDDSSAKINMGQKFLSHEL